MIELQSEQKPFFYIAAVLLGVEILYFLGLVNTPISGWEIYASILALSISIPLLVGTCLGLMVAYMAPAKNLMLGGLLTCALWFFLALASLSNIAAIIGVFVSVVSYKMLQYYHQDLKKTAQQSVQSDEPASGGATD